LIHERPERLGAEYINVAFKRNVLTGNNVDIPVHEWLSVMIDANGSQLHQDTPSRETHQRRASERALPPGDVH